MTLQEAKDKTAKEYGYSDWGVLASKIDFDEVINTVIRTYNNDQIEQYKSLQIRYDDEVMWRNEAEAKLKGLAIEYEKSSLEIRTLKANYRDVEAALLISDQENDKLNLEVRELEDSIITLNEQEQKLKQQAEYWEKEANYWKAMTTDNPQHQHANYSRPID